MTGAAIFNTNITFEEILKQFTTMDSSEKSAVLQEQLKIYLKDKPLKERQFLGSILLSITKDNASQLLKTIKEHKDYNLLDLLENEIKKL